MQKYFRHSIVSIDEVISAIRDYHALDTVDKKIKEKKVIFNGQSINIKSLRLRTFAEKGIKCVGCGLQGTHFAIERDQAQENNDGSYHLNLWCYINNGQEVLFTHDHILARSLGGKDRLENTQTMCTICNFEKSIGEHEEVKKRNSEKSV